MITNESRNQFYFLKRKDISIGRMEIQVSKLGRTSIGKFKSRSMQ